MSMSSFVIAFRPPDERWKQMKAVWDSCNQAGIDVPQEVDEFFNGEAPDPEGVEVGIEEAVTRWADKCCEGFQIELEKLPKGIKYLRFYNSY